MLVLCRHRHTSTWINIRGFDCVAIETGLCCSSDVMDRGRSQPNVRHQRSVIYSFSFIIVISDCLVILSLHLLILLFTRITSLFCF